jgi:hypothetical protein
MLRDDGGIGQLGQQLLNATEKVWRDAMGRENRISLLYQLQGPYKSQLQLHNIDDIGHYAPLHIRNTVKVGRTASVGGNFTISGPFALITHSPWVHSN